MTPREINGFWWVDWADKYGEPRSAGPFKSNSEAWRWIDRDEGQPISKAEDRSEFAWNRSVDRRYA